MTAMLAPNAGRIFLGERHHRARAGRRGWARGGAHFQINTLFPGLNAARSGDARGLRTARRRPIVLWRNIAVHRESIDEA